MAKKYEVYACTWDAYFHLDYTPNILIESSFSNKTVPLHWQAHLL